MARSEARIRCAVWQDPEFTKLPRSAQGLYWMLLSQPDVTLAGVLPFMPGRWAMLAADDTADGDLADLEASRFVVVDRTTCEVLIRTFAKHDGVLRSEKTRAGMWSAWAGVFSPTIRARFVAQLDDEVVTEAVEREWVSQKALDALPDLTERPEHALSDGVSREAGDGVSDGGTPRVRADSVSDSTSVSDSSGASGAREGLPAAIVIACGMDYPAPGTRASQQLDTASADLARQGAMPHDVPARARVYRARWPDATLTPHALAKHWPQLIPDKPKVPVTETEEQARARFESLTGGAA